ncbi:MAG: hypothetical protein MJ246_03865 [Clostridia bacterium]|nr:hypothetical protein [Clostridia bacterium]
MKKALVITLSVIAALAAAYAILISWASKVYGEIDQNFDDNYDEWDDYFEEE